jgi:hypothetical protein
MFKDEEESQGLSNEVESGFSISKLEDRLVEVGMMDKGKIGIFFSDGKVGEEGEDGLGRIVQEGEGGGVQYREGERVIWTDMVTTGED